MMMPNSVNLATSNISEKETNKKTTESTNLISGKSFSSFFVGKNLKSQLGNEKNLEGKLSKVGHKSEKDSKDKTLSGVVVQGNIPSFVMPEKKDESVGKRDFGNRIESGNVMSQSNSLTSVKKLDKNKALTEGILSSEKLEESALIKTNSNMSNKVTGESNGIINVKPSNLDKDINELYKVKEKEMINTGLKFKELANKSEIVVAKEISPQSKGRICIKNEHEFLPNNIEKNTFINSNVFESDLRSVNNELKLIGTSSYGLKKFNELEKKGGEENKELVTSIGVGHLNKTNNNFDNYLLKTNENHVLKNDFMSIVEQVENGIKMNFNSQLKEMKIKLQPEELGEIDIKLKIDNNIMKAEFVVSSQQVKEILESKFDILKNNLLEKGFNPSEINVFVSTDSRKDKSNNSNSFEFENSRKIKNVRNSVNKLNGIDNLDKQSVRRRALEKDSSLDIFV